MPTETSKATKWDGVIAMVDAGLQILKRKPRRLKIGYQCSPGGILNAYREGDLTFKQAVQALKKWKRDRD